MKMQSITIPKYSRSRMSFKDNYQSPVALGSADRIYLLHSKECNFYLEVAFPNFWHIFNNLLAIFVMVSSCILLRTHEYNLLFFEPPSLLELLVFYFLVFMILPSSWCVPFNFIHYELS